MATAYHGGSQSPTSLSKPIERVFEDAQHTGEILLSGRKLREYPKLSAKYDLVDTISADLSKNRLNEVPKEICQYVSMEKLVCYHNVIKIIPDALIQLQALTYLNLSRNQLSIIPVFVSQMQALEVLIASHNRLVSLPEEIGVLDKLMELDVSCNEISHLPMQIGDLKSLKSLNVRRNFLQELPVEISKLNLRKLDISANRISKIPTLFRKIETLEDMILDNNPLTLPPAHICIKGKQHIMKYLQTEATREEKKRGILNEQEMKRFRKSLPPAQSVSSEEFRNLMESPDKWKRHTVLSSDSGYSTADSIEKSWSPQETNTEAQHIIDSNSLVTKATVGIKDQRVVAGRVPPDPPQRTSSRVSPDKTPTPTSHEPPHFTLPTAQYRNAPVPPTLYPTSPQTPLTPPTPQGPGPGSDESPGQGTTTTTTIHATPSSEDVFTRELQRQKQEYENQKKIAAHLRQQQEEEDEKEQRRRAAQRIQDEQRALLDRQREEVRVQEEARQWEENRQRELEEQRRQEEAVRQREEAARMEEAKKAEEAQRQKATNNFYNPAYNKGHDWPPPPSNLTNQHEALSQPELSHYNSHSQPTHNLHSPTNQYGFQRSPQIGYPSPNSPRLQSPTSPSQYKSFSPGSHSERVSSPRMNRFGLSSSSYSHTSSPNRSPNDRHGQSPQGHYHSPGQGQGQMQYTPQTGVTHRSQGHYNIPSPVSPGGDPPRIVSPGHQTEPSPGHHGSVPDPSHYGRYGNQHGQSEHVPYNSMPLDPYSGYRKPSLSASNSFKEERRPAGTTQQYRRTTSDSNQRLPVHQAQPMTNGPIAEQPTVNGSASSHLPSNTSPNTSFTSTSSAPTHKSPHVVNGPTADAPPETATRKTRPSTDKTTTSTTMASRMAKPSSRTSTGLTKTGVPTARKTNLMQSEEVRKSQQNLKAAGQTDGPKARGEQRLKTIQKEATNNYLNRRSSGSTSSEDGKRSTPTRSLAYQGSSSAASKRSGTVMNASHVKMMEEYNKDGSSNFTMRRQHEHQRDSHELMEKLRKTISTRLKRSLPENLSEALSDGVLLCHLANQIRPRSVASVHVPSPAVPKLTPAKCRRNVDNFLEACRKIGVPKDQICGASDILEEKGINKVATTVSALVAIATQSKHPPATNV